MALDFVVHQLSGVIEWLQDAQRLFLTEIPSSPHHQVKNKKEEK